MLPLPTLAAATPWLAIAAAVALGGTYFLGRSHGADSERADHAAALVESVERAAEQARAIALQDAEVVNTYEKTRTRTVYLTPKVAEVKDHAKTADTIPECHLTDDALSLLNEARGYPAPGAAHPGPSAGGLPAAPEAHLQAPQRREGTPLSSGTRLLRLRSEAPGTGWGSTSTGGI